MRGVWATALCPGPRREEGSLGSGGAHRRRDDAAEAKAADTGTGSSKGDLQLPMQASFPPANHARDGQPQRSQTSPRAKDGGDVRLLEARRPSFLHRGDLP